MSGRARVVISAGLLALVTVVAGCKSQPSGMNAQEAAGSLALTVVSFTASPSFGVVPGGTLAVSAVVKNTGTAVWKPADVALVWQGESGWTQTTLTTTQTVKGNKTGTFTGQLRAPSQIGLYALAWQARFQGNALFGPQIVGATEVTCSDGVFCNGDERYVNGACASGPPPCGFGSSCTQTVCDEASGTCLQPQSSTCVQCLAKNCTPHCRGECGDDGCGQSCGVCPSGKACADGVCVTAALPGTCATPLGITGDPNTALAPGNYRVTGSTVGGFNEVVPTCNATSAAPEKIYKITIGAGQTMGIDAQSYGFDTVLHLRSAACETGATLACSDDSAPPGNYGSHIAALLPTGAYYLIVDGFDSTSIGSYTLDIKAVPGCRPQCDGKFCGDDGCGNSTGCGACGANQLCNAAARCVDSPCKPDCNGRKCGSNGCGGTCGNNDGGCPSGQLCIVETGACKTFPECNHDRPVCKTACSSNQYCGTDCACHDNRADRPDLVLSKTRLQNEWFIDYLDVSPTSCAIAEECVGGPGMRKLLRFSVEAVNQGLATLTVPPPKSRPDLFTYSPCHGHYHFSGFAKYGLSDLAGNTVLDGKKLAYCMEDTIQVLKGPAVACNKKYDCATQGIQSGWSDLYGNALDCQWLDVTDTPPGTYTLTVTVNPSRAFEEASFGNNTATIQVVVP